jgi:adenylate kinase
MAASLNPGLSVILLGAPGAGKGTQADLLKSRLSFAHISTGDLIRAEIAAGSPLAAEMKAIQATGKLVPDSIVETLLTQALKQRAGQPVIFDGYPRNRAQAETLDRILTLRPGKTICINMKVDEARLFDRITSRLNCKICKKVYNSKSNPPKMAGRCDDCGGELFQREDDKPETLKIRLDTYRAETLPMIEYYAAQGRLITIDGDGELEAVFARLQAALENASN